MPLTTHRQRQVIFVIMGLMTAALAYEGEAAEINAASEEYFHLRHEVHTSRTYQSFQARASYLVITQ